MTKKDKYLIIVLLIVASFLAFGWILDNGFTNFDDNSYLTENHQIQHVNLQNIQWSFTAVVAGNWHPMTLLSHMLDWSLFGTNASGHHLVSLFLHIGAVIFLFLFFNKTTNTLWPAAFAAALFALHPLRVESVAWAAERKDVLSMFFGMATLYVYACCIENFKLSKYLLCLSLFTLSLMSKPMLVTIPFIMLLLDFWPLGRWPEALTVPIAKYYKLIGRLVWEKTPFFLLSLASITLTIWAQKKDGSVASFQQLPFLDRLTNAIVSYMFYLEKTFWPVNLAAFYPYDHFLPLWKILISGIVLLGITTAVLYNLKKLPFLLVGWLWYLGTLIPVIGLVQVGGQATADRYTYLPSIGISIMLAWGINCLVKREDIRKKILFPLGLVILVILTILTCQQCLYWKSSTTLFNHALQVTKNNYLLHNNLGLALIAEGKIEEAINHYNNAIRIQPYYIDAYNNRGNAYSKLGRYQQATEDYDKAISMKADYVKAWINRGNLFHILGQNQRAIENFNEAIRLNPHYHLTYFNRGNLYLKLGYLQSAIDDFNKTIALAPPSFDVYNNRGFTYLKLDQHQKAFEDFSKAIYLNPVCADAYYNRGLVSFILGDKILGCSDAIKACELGNCRMLEIAKNKGDCL